MRKNKRITRNYQIHSDRSKLIGVGYVEIGTGRYSDIRSNEQIIFIDEDSFDVVEGIVKKNYPRFDHYEVNNISRTKGSKIIINLREASETILDCTGPDILRPIEYKIDSSPATVNEFIKQKTTISKMLSVVADYIDKAYEGNNWIYLFGIGCPKTR